MRLLKYKQYFIAKLPNKNPKLEYYYPRIFSQVLTYVIEVKQEGEIFFSVHQAMMQTLLWKETILNLSI